MKSERTFLEAIIFEYLAYLKQKGKAPKALIISEVKLKDKFFSEIHEFILKTDGALFENPEKYIKFYGMDVIICDWKYGGGLQGWGFGE